MSRAATRIDAGPTRHATQCRIARRPADPLAGSPLPGGPLLACLDTFRRLRHARIDPGQPVAVSAKRSMRIRLTSRSSTGEKSA